MAVPEPLVPARAEAGHRPVEAGSAPITLDSSGGLPSNQIHKIARDGWSRLWLAGPAGLSCFDGSVVHGYDRRTGLRCSGLRSVAVGTDDTVWVGTDLGLEALDTSGQPLPWMAWFAWPFGLCEHIDAAGDHVWIGSAQGLVRMDRVAGKAGPQVGLHAAIGFVRHLVRDGDDHLYATSDALGVVELRGGHWWPLRNAQLLNRRAYRLALAPGGALIVGTDSGVVVVDTTTSDAVVLDSLPPGQTAVTALATGRNEWWLGLGRTLLSFPDARPGAVAAERYQLGSRINDLRVDELGNVWVATDTTGLALVSCLRHSLGRVDVGSRGAVFSIKPAPDGSMTVGGEGFVCSVPAQDDLPPRRIHGTERLAETTVWDSHADGSGLWLAAHSGLYHASDGGDLVQMLPNDPVVGAPARVLVPRGDELWVGTLCGLSRIHDGKAEEVRPSDGEPLGYVYALHLDEQGALWVATLGRGLWREHGGLEPVSVGALTAKGNTYAVAKGPGGILVLQDEKVILLDGTGGARVLEERHPVSGWTCLWLNERTVAIGSADGLRLLDTVSGRVSTSIRSLFSARDWEFTNNRTLVPDLRGGLLCGVNGGLVRVDLEQLRTLLTPPVVRLTDIRWHGTTPETVGGEYRVHPGRWTVHLRAFAAWFLDHQTLRFRFRLIGFDEAWTPLQATPEITYNSLPPGQYEITVQAHSPLTGFGAPATLCRLRVARPWWTVGWAPALARAGDVYDRLVRSGSRNRELRGRNLALEEEVAERTQALRRANEELQRTRLDLERLSLTDALTQLSNRRHLDAQLHHEIQRCRRGRSAPSLLLLDIDHFKAVNDRLGHPVGDDYLRAVADALRRSARLEVDTLSRFGGEEFAYLMPETNAEQALVAAERLRAAVESLALPNAGAPSGRLTISVGMATLDPQGRESEAAFVARADAALYEAKSRGRNRIAASAQPAGEARDWHSS